MEDKYITFMAIDPTFLLAKSSLFIELEWIFFTN
jgi:hypothetical protein